VGGFGVKKKGERVLGGEGGGGGGGGGLHGFFASKWVGILGCCRHGNEHFCS